MSRARGPLFVVNFRRRRQGVTDYAKRVALLKSGLPRLVVRKSNKYVIVQVVEFSEKGDETIAAATSRQLSKLGFQGKANTPSAYLTGFLVGKRALAKGASECAADFGRHAATKGSLLYAAVKGAVDAGLKIPASPEVLPSKERIEGKNLKNSTGFAEALEKLRSLQVQQHG